MPHLKAFAVGGAQNLKAAETSGLRSVRSRTSDVRHFALMKQSAQTHLQAVRVIPAT